MSGPLALAPGWLVLHDTTGAVDEPELGMTLKYYACRDSVGDPPVSQAIVAYHVTSPSTGEFFACLHLCGAATVADQANFRSRTRAFAWLREQFLRPVQEVTNARQRRRRSRRDQKP